VCTSASRASATVPTYATKDAAGIEYGTEVNPISVRLIAPPLYVMTCNTLDQVCLCPLRPCPACLLLAAPFHSACIAKHPSPARRDVVHALVSCESHPGWW
jgi:hypothetical protein